MTVLITFHDCFGLFRGHWLVMFFSDVVQICSDPSGEAQDLPELTAAAQEVPPSCAAGTCPTICTSFHDRIKSV